MSQFIDSVNQILRREGIIRGDDDNLTTFSDTTHNATSQLAQISVQDEIAKLISDGLLSYQHKTSTITLSTGVRSYSLPNDFVQLFGDQPFFYDPVQNVEFFEFPGGENALRLQYFDYLTTTGAPNYWYFEQTTNKKVSWFQVPNSDFNGKVYNFDYMADVNVTNSTDTLPFQTTNEYNAFVGMAARRFRFLYRQEDISDLDSDKVYKTYRSTFFRLTRGKKLTSRYGCTYVSPQS